MSNYCYMSHSPAILAEGLQKSQGKTRALTGIDLVDQEGSVPHWDHNLWVPDKKRRRVKMLLPAQLAIHNQIVPIAIAPLRLAEHALTGKTSLLQRPLFGTIGDIRRGFNAHNGIDREKIFGQ